MKYEYYEEDSRIETLLINISNELAELNMNLSTLPRIPEVLRDILYHIRNH